MPYRIIFSLYLDLRCDPDGTIVGLVVPLDRQGNGRWTRPRPPKRRCIDLRVGDRVLCHGRWRTVAGVAAYRECRLTEEQAGRREDDGEGYLYRVA